MNSLPEYDFTASKDNEYSLYEKTYSHWLRKCHTAEDSKAVTPQDVIVLIDNAQAIKVYTIVLFSMALFIVFLCLANVTCYSLKKRNFIESKSMLKLTWIRLAFSILSSGVCAFCCVKMIMLTDKDTLTYLTENSCTQDIVLQDSFVTMLAY